MLLRLTTGVTAGRLLPPAAAAAVAVWGVRRLEVCMMKLGVEVTLPNGWMPSKTGVADRTSSMPGPAAAAAAKAWEDTALLAGWCPICRKHSMLSQEANAWRLLVPPAGSSTIVLGALSVSDIRAASSCLQATNRVRVLHVLTRHIV